jgi:hypothetical protein
MRLKYISAVLSEETDATLTSIREAANVAMDTIESSFTASSPSDIEKVISSSLLQPNHSLLYRAVSALLLHFSLLLNLNCDAFAANCGL